MDAARAAVRLDTKKVSILYRRTRQEMPADSTEIEQALEEGIDIVYLVAPTRIRRQNRRLNVTCARMELGEPDDSGRQRPVPINGSEFDEELGSHLKHRAISGSAWAGEAPFKLTL
jgi:NADPH-dependent glutamate synthase beta subunit-like oxidoreductase